MSEGEDLALMGKQPDKDGGAVSRLMARASSARKWLFGLFIVLQGAFMSCFFYKSDVFQLGTGVIAGASVSFVLLVVAGGILIATAPSSKQILLCMLVCAWVWMLLFSSWLQLFVLSATYELNGYPPVPRMQERVLSGFVVLLVFSSDVFSALSHLNDAQPNWKEVLPVGLIAVGLVAVTMTQRFLASLDMLPFEITLTALIVLLHLQASLVGHETSTAGLALAVGVSLTGLAGLCVAICLYVLEKEPVADVMHRSVDVLLLLESHISRVALLRR